MKKNKEKAFVFDLDGTVVDTQTPVHAKAECLALRECTGIEIEPSEISARFAGIPTRKVFEELAPGADIDFLIKRKWEIIDEIIQHTNMNDLDLLASACLGLAKAQFPIAIASASPMWYIQIVLSRIDAPYPGFLNTFDYVVSAESVPSPKPAPDVFLDAADNLRIEPKDCIVIGDGAADVTGGLAAGMSVLYFSQDESFDDNPKVTRFTDSDRLGKYLLSLV